MLVERSPDDRNLLSVFILQTLYPVADPVGPGPELVVQVSVGEYSAHDAAVAVVPRTSACGRVVQMPAQTYYAAPGVVLSCSFGHKGEIIAVQVAAVAQLDVSQVQAQNGRVFPADILHVGSFHQFVNAVSRVPLVSVHQVVLMAVERDVPRGLDQPFFNASGFVSTRCHSYQRNR